MKNHKILSRIYVTSVVLVMIFAMSTIAYGFSWNGTINYIANYPGQTAYSDIKVKSDDSSAIVAYDSGPSMGTVMFVEIWGSQDYSKNYVNYTLSHLYNGKYVTYYTVNRGEQALILNLVYETYGKAAFTKLKVYTTAQEQFRADGVRLQNKSVGSKIAICLPFNV